MSVTWLTPGSIRETLPSNPLATQIAPYPAASPVGVVPSEIVCWSDSVLGSILDTVRSSRFATQTDPSPAVTEEGLMPTATEAVTLFDCGSMTATEFGVT